MLLGEIDGRRIAISGDEFQLDRHGAIRGGGPVYRNRLRVGSFTRSSENLTQYQPELLLSGHDGPIEMTLERLTQAREWSEELDSCFRALADFPYGTNFAVDPYWIEVTPYQQTASADKEISIEIRITNHDEHNSHEVTFDLDLPDQWVGPSEPQRINIDPLQSGSVRVALRSPAGAASGRYVLPLTVDFDDVSADGLVEAIVTIC